MIINYCTYKEREKGLIDRKRVRDIERDGVKERESEKVCMRERKRDR